MMKMRWMVAGLVLAGCATPYQAMGFRGGYEATRTGAGIYVVHVRVNAFTSQGTAIAYAHRRAGELCTNGYQMVDSATDAQRSYWVQGNTVNEVRKPEVTIVVRCQ